MSSADSQNRETQSQKLMDELLKKNKLKSCDDDQKDFSFKSFERAMT